MPWFEFEPAKKPPFVAEEPADDWRIPATVFLWVSAFALMLAGVLGWLLFQARNLGLWGVGLSLACTALAFILFPKSKR